MVMNPMVEFVEITHTHTKKIPRMYNPILANGILRVSGKKKKNWQVDGSKHDDKRQRSLKK